MTDTEPLNRDRADLKRRRIFGLIALGFFTASLFTPAMGPDRPLYEARWVLGYEPLLFGWLGVIVAGYLPWLANPILIILLAITLSGARANRWVAMSAVLLTYWGSVPLHIPGYHNAEARGLGYWLWVGSAVTIMISAWVERRHSSPATIAGPEVEPAS